MTATRPLDVIDDIIATLRRCDLFRHSPLEFITHLARQVDIMELEADTQIMVKGDAGDTMYMIGKGEIEVHDGDVVIRRLTAGDVFGELSALVSEVRTASVRAVSDCVLYRLDQQTVYDTLGAHVEAYRSLIEGLCDRGRDIAQYGGAQAGKVQLFEQELAIGRQIQEGFLPEILPDVAGWELDAHFQAAREVAGDFYDVFEVKDLNRVAILIGDVCGKGVGAALFMTLFRSLLRSAMLVPAVTGAQNAPEPDRTLLQAIVSTNAYIASTHAKSSMFASVFFALLDPGTGELSYVNGGHESPVIVSDESVIRELDITGPALGLFADAHFAVDHTRLDSGALMCAYTDGVSEAMDASKNQFGVERIKAVLKDEHQSATAAIKAMAAALDEFARDMEQHDDITLLAVRRRD